jgi:hypothetical protein
MKGFFKGLLAAVVLVSLCLLLIPNLSAQVGTLTRRLIGTQDIYWATGGTGANETFNYVDPSGNVLTLIKPDASYLKFRTSLWGAARSVDSIVPRIGYEIWVGDPLYPTFAAAVATLNSAGTNCILRLPAGTHAVSADLIVNSNISLKPERGAILTIANTKTLTINGPIDAGLYQVFACTSSGKVDFGEGSVEKVYPEWWGIATDAATMLAFQAAVNTGLRVMVTGQYTLDNSASALMLSNTTNAYATLEGAHGWSASWLEFTSTAHPGIQYGFTTGLPNITIKNLALYGPTGTTAGNFGFYFPAASYDAARIVIKDVLIRNWGDDGIRLDGSAGPILIENAQMMDCKYGITVSTVQDVTIRGGSIHSCLGGISIDGGAGTLGGISVYDTDIELAAATLPALYLKGSYGNVFHGLTLAITPGTLSVGDSLVYMDTGCGGNTFTNLLTNAAGGLNNFYIQGERNTIIGGFHYNDTTPTGDGYFVRNHGTYTSVINPLLGTATYAAGKGIVYNDAAELGGMFVGVPCDASGRPGIMMTQSEINNGMSQWRAQNAVGGVTDFVNNAYYASGWKYFLADQASKISQQDGVITFSTATAGAAPGDAITWSDRLIINNAGKFTLPGGLTTYADNAAALSGGLTAGDLYKTATGVVMIVYTP